ncbi:MAG: PilZ domain-containing protein [Myxococcales bacterium]|nr:PilZ domain-containing protein [Myxococcales bacterium]
MSPVELRRSPRISAELSVTGKRPVYFHARTRDASADGLFIRLADPFAVGTRLALHLRLPTCEVPLEMRAEVVRVSHEPVAGAGVRLLHSSEAQRAYLEGQLARLARGDGGIPSA